MTFALGIIVGLIISWIALEIYDIVDEAFYR